MKTYFFLIFSFLTSSIQNLHKGQDLEKGTTDIVFKLINTELIVDKDYSNLIAEPEHRNIKYSITNNTDENYVLVIDSSNFYIYSNTEWLNQWYRINNDDFDKQLFKLGIRIGNNGKFKNTGYNIISEYFGNLPALKCTINKSLIILKPRETIFRQIDFTYPVIINKTNNSGLAQFFLLDDPEYFSIFLFQDKNLILKNLSKENKQKLEKLNAEIYTGLLESNKIPIKLE